jgi:hypothetical protein
MFLKTINPLIILVILAQNRKTGQIDHVAGLSSVIFRIVLFYVIACPYLFQ